MSVQTGKFSTYMSTNENKNKPSSQTACSSYINNN